MSNPPTDDSCLQVHGLFKYTTSDDDGVCDADHRKVCIVGRWLARVPDIEVSRTVIATPKQSVWSWAKAPERLRLPGFGSAWFDVQDFPSVLESVTMLPVPRGDGDIKLDTGSIGDDNRRMWMHSAGQSALGET